MQEKQIVKEMIGKAVTGFLFLTHLLICLVISVWQIFNYFRHVLQQIKVRYLAALS
jgi:hypothetical protein